MRIFVSKRGRQAVRFAIEDLEDRQLLSSSPVVLPYSALEKLLAPATSITSPQLTQSIAAGGNIVVNQAPGALSGKVVYTQGGHGYTYLFDSTTNKYIYETQAAPTSTTWSKTPAIRTR